MKVKERATMKNPVNTVLGVILILLVIAIAPTAVRMATTTSQPRTAEITKEQYLKQVRKNNPSDPEFYVCMYDGVIDEWGVQKTMRFDLKYADPNGTTPVPGDELEVIERHAQRCDV